MGLYAHFVLVPTLTYHLVGDRQLRALRACILRTILARANVVLRRITLSLHALPGSCDHPAKPVDLATICEKFFSHIGKGVLRKRSPFPPRKRGPHPTPLMFAIATHQ